jgi:hypothetical protein
VKAFITLQDRDEFHFLIGSVHEFGTPEYDEYIPSEIRKPGSRAAIVIDIYKVSTVRYHILYLHNPFLNKLPSHADMVYQSMIIGATVQLSSSVSLERRRSTSLQPRQHPNVDLRRTGRIKTRRLWTESPVSQKPDSPRRGSERRTSFSAETHSFLLPSLLQTKRRSGGSGYQASM